MCLRTHGCAFNYTEFSHRCALHSCVGIFTIEMAGQMSDEQANHEVAVGVLVEQCVPVAVEIPGGETTQGQWQLEMGIFMEPMTTNCGREDWNGLTYEFPLQLYTCFPMTGELVHEQRPSGHIRARSVQNT